MSCTQGREHTLYAVQTTRDVSDIGVEYLADSVSSSLYKPWEVQRTGPRLKLELATRKPVVQAALTSLYELCCESRISDRKL